MLTKAPPVTERPADLEEIAAAGVDVMPAEDPRRLEGGGAEPVEAPPLGRLATMAAKPEERPRRGGTGEVPLEDMVEWR